MQHKLISGDNHIDLTYCPADLWTAQAPVKWKQTAPRVGERNDGQHWFVDDKDRVWATDWAANAIQRFDPAAETFATFPSDTRGASVRQMSGRPGEAWGGGSGNDRPGVRGE